jgi:hypothetical protein
VSLRLDPADTLLAIIDWQERLFSAMNLDSRDEALTRVGHLKWLADSLSLPVVVSEQYPRGLGPTVSALGVDGAISKTSFSAMEAAGFAAAVAETGRSTVVLAGMETHICVAQTCRDLLAAGLVVCVVADACLSRRRLDWELGLERMRFDGARIVTAEAALFELLGDAQSPLFKELSRRIR